MYVIAVFCLRVCRRGSVYVVRGWAVAVRVLEFEGESYYFFFPQCGDGYFLYSGGT